MTRVGILLSGRGSNMRALVEQARGYEVALIASDKPEAAGIAWARERGLPTFALSPKGIGKAAFEAEIDRALREAGVEVIALAGYMRLLSDDFVARWRGRIVNIHPSLLPRYKGLDTHARAIAAGDAVAGCSVHLVTEELDGGAVLGQAQVPVLPDDTPETLAERVLAEEHRLYPRVLSEFTMTPLDRLRTLAAALPEVEERPSHGQATWFVAGKQFAQFRDDHHGDGRTVVCVRTGGTDEGDMLIGADPETYSRPAYLGASGWVALNLAGDVDWALVEDRVARSWELAAPARLLEAGGR
ncbi:phosphoribosylglycinamide formyltransferase [Sphingomonas aracearum]|uniref:Phosphoribosylglycinamide formyltransferase n=1 Tax=Sphingomonas aracearum TaxID=2283317 RepID=A0A369VXM3_9SPHN|nr:phosphoribosylglycinamide formyltransferase [Sphingomonas aracearum]RDE06357.1 phosphoribosylglycinamide formyltransferase [Sphingomonas aracearum]